uniref:ATP-binding protein n=1 Tax=Streptomyces albidus (ex Kaewkla and Franco 2022) TaxID=722709 RepID=UPI0015EF5241
MDGVTIGDRVAGQADRLVGRSRELALFGRVLAGTLDRNVLLVHGPGGIGKTELLRASLRKSGMDGYMFLRPGP